MVSVKEELERTINEKDVLQKDLKKLTNENRILAKLRDEMTTEICNIQACFSLFKTSLQITKYKSLTLQLS